MELAGRTIRDRVLQAIVVFSVLFAFQYYRNAVDLIHLVTVTAIFFALMTLIDATRTRFAN